MSNEVSDTDLHAFVDGELTLERAAAVEAALARDLLLAARVHHFRADKLALIAAYEPFDPVIEQALAARENARTIS
jgi:anti-sigma factor RsiW